MKEGRNPQIVCRLRPCEGMNELFRRSGRVWKRYCRSVNRNGRAGLFVRNAMFRYDPVIRCPTTYTCLTVPCVRERLYRLCLAGCFRAGCCRNFDRRRGGCFRACSCLRPFPVCHCRVGSRCRRYRGGCFRACSRLRPFPVCHCRVGSHYRRYRGGCHRACSRLRPAGGGCRPVCGGHLQVCPVFRAAPAKAVGNCPAAYCGGNGRAFRLSGQSAYRDRDSGRYGCAGATHGHRSSRRWQDGRSNNSRSDSGRRRGSTTRRAPNGWGGENSRWCGRGCTASRTGCNAGLHFGIPISIPSSRKPCGCS